MHFIGMAGLPRRYYTNTAFPYFDDLADINVLITVFALVAGFAQLVFLYNFIHSMFYGKPTVQNPLEIQYARVDSANQTFPWQLGRGYSRSTSLGI